MNRATIKNITLTSVSFFILIMIFIAFPNYSRASSLNFNVSVFGPHPDTQVKLEWNSIYDSGYYYLYRNGVLIKTIDTNLSRNYVEYIDTDLIPDLLYTYSITYTTYSGQVLDSDTKNITTSKIIIPQIASAIYNINTARITVALSKSSAYATGMIVRDEFLNMPSVYEVSANRCVFYDYLLNGLPNRRYKVASIDQYGRISDYSNLINIIPLTPPKISAKVKSNLVTISWPKYDKISYFSLERSKYEDETWSSWETIKTQIPQGDLSIDDIIQNGNSFRYRLRINHPAYQGTSNISNPVAIPIAPTKIRCQLNSSNRINLTWISNKNVESMLKIERKMESDPYSEVAILNSSIESYSDRFNILEDKTYYYRITAFDNNQNLAISSEVSINTGIPSIPTELSASIVSASTITLNFKDNSNNEEGFEIQKKVGAGIYSTIHYVDVDTKTYTDTDVVRETTYTYRIRSYNLAGNSEFSNEVSCSTNNFGNLPSTLALTPISDTQIDLSWTNTSGTNYGIIIERKDGEDGEWSEVVTLGKGTTSYSDIELQADTKYYYRIRSIIGINIYSASYPNDNGEAAYTLESSPTYVTAFWNTDGKVELSWMDNSQETQFIIEKKADEGEYSIVAITSKNVAKWIDSSAVAGSTYTYRVKAQSLVSYSNYSSEVTVESPAIDAPEILEGLFQEGSKIRLNWKDNSQNEIGFKIERKLSETGEWTQVGNVSKDITSYINESIILNTNYYYRVKAYNPKLRLEATSEEFLVFTEEIKQPGNLTLSCTLPTRVILTWSDKSENEDGFVIERKEENGQYIKIGTTKVNVGTFIDNGLNPSTKYFYRVVAYNSNGYSSYTPDQSITTEESIKFQDIPKDYVSYNSIIYLANKGIIKKSSRFYPDNTVTRAEFISFIVKSFNLNKRISGSFRDVPSTHTFYKDIMIAKLYGIINGDGSNRFYPDQQLTVKDMAVIIVKTMKVVKTPLNSPDTSVLSEYYDVGNIPSYAMASIATLVGEGIITGDGNSIYPNESLTRAQICEILYKLLTRTKQN